MSKALPLLAVVLLGTMPLLGCIGGEDLDQQSLDGVLDGPSSRLAQVHAGAAPGQASQALGSDALGLPEGVPLPAGLDRHTGFGVFEPTLGVTSDGALFMSNLERSELRTEHSSIIRSTDQGVTWEDITPSIGPVSSPPNSNDPYVYVDEATDRVYNLDMQGLACNWIQWSDDGGETWTQNPLGCGQPPLLDHPTLFAGPPQMFQTQGYENVVHLCVNRVADSACSRSLDGGLTFSPFQTVYPGADPEKAEADTTDPTSTGAQSFCGGLHGHGTAGPEGTVYLPRGYCGTPTVAISQDDGLTWERVAISEEVETLGHEVAVAVDTASNVYAFWISTDRKPYLAVSTDQGQSWSEPTMVAPPGVGTTAFPTIAAGTDGRIAMAYIGTEAEAPYGAMGHSDTWNAYITTTVEATAQAAAFATVTTNDPADPIARGECGGTRCFGEEGGALGDFIDIVIDDRGRPWAAFVDACTETCAQEGGYMNDVGVGFVGTLSQGPSLRGELVALPPLTMATGAGATG